MLLEPFPVCLITGTLTETQFIQFLSEAVDEFQSVGGLDVRLISQMIHFGYGLGATAYTEPDQLTSIRAVMANNKLISSATADSLDCLLRNWRVIAPGQPRYWHEDRLPMNTMEIVPTANYEGYNYAVTGGGSFYGTLSAAATLTSNVPFYGVISSTTGPTFFCSAGDYGTISSLYPSDLNLTMIGDYRADSTQIIGLTSYIFTIPSLFQDYLMYGVLALTCATNSELKDTPRAKYFAARWTEGLNLAKMISDEAVGLNFQSGE
jgi:hypothetical protein